MEGIAKKADPGKRVDLDMYAEGHKVRGARKLPLYLLDAIRLFDKDKGLKAAMGESFASAYVKIKMREWDLFSQQLSDWERGASLDV